MFNLTGKEIGVAGICLAVGSAIGVGFDKLAIKMATSKKVEEVEKEEKVVEKVVEE